MISQKIWKIEKILKKSHLQPYILNVIINNLVYFLSVFYAFIFHKQFSIWLFREKLNYTHFPTLLQDFVTIRFLFFRLEIL